MCVLATELGNRGSEELRGAQGPQGVSGPGFGALPAWLAAALTAEVHSEREKTEHTMQPISPAWDA